MMPTTFSLLLSIGIYILCCGKVHRVWSIHTHTHTHTHMYIYIYICIYIHSQITEKQASGKVAKQYFIGTSNLSIYFNLPGHIWDPKSIQSI
jgi:hypothetical protein